MSKIKTLLRVACFSEVNDSILMWSHYSQNHSGFCIEYDMHDSYLRDHLNPVRYVSERHYIRGDFADTSSQSGGKYLLEAALYKAEAWSYEKEWRLVMPRPGFKRPEYKDAIPVLSLKEYITAVYLGAKSDERYQTSICEHFNGSSVKVYKMSLQSDSYKLVPILIQ